MVVRIFILWIVLHSPIVGHCSEWIYVTNNTVGDKFFVDRASIEQNDHIIFFRGLRNYATPEKRFGSFSSIGNFEADCARGGIRLHQFNYYAGEMGQGKIVNSFPIADTEWFNPRQGTVGSKQLELVCLQFGNLNN